MVLNVQRGAANSRKHVTRQLMNDYRTILVLDSALGIPAVHSDRHDRASSAGPIDTYFDNFFCPQKEIHRLQYKL